MKRPLKWRNRGAIAMVVVAAVLGCIVGVAYACPPPTIMFKPADATRSAVVRFSFLDAQRGGVTFVCSLDGSGAHPCASPTTYSGLPAGRHTFSVVARSGAGTSLSTSYAWTIDRRPPSISIGFPRTGSAYGRPVWSAGCARRQGGVCGTAFDSVGVDSVRVSIKQNATGRYWNGHRFTARNQMYFRASLSPQRRTGSSSPQTWFYALRLPSPDGAYTLHVRAADKLRNVTLRKSPAQSVFRIDTVAPSVVLTSHPTGPSTSQTARFSFGANKPVLSFKCSLDGASFQACTSPSTYSNLSLGRHRWVVRAVDAAGNASGLGYSWQVVKPAAVDPAGGLATSGGMLYPGIAGSGIPVTLGNPNGFSIHVTAVNASLQSTNAPGCSAGWFGITQPSFPSGGIVVPPHGSVTLPAQGATAPAVRLIESGTNQDACQGARLSLTYAASAYS